MQKVAEEQIYFLLYYNLTLNTTHYLQMKSLQFITQQVFYPFSFQWFQSLGTMRKNLKQSIEIRCLTEKVREDILARLTLMT